MTNVPPGFASLIRIPLTLLLLAAPLLVRADLARAEPCGPDALGTARMMNLDSTQHPRVGRKHFPQTLPLKPREVVLTFDDGPSAQTTGRVLDALGKECVRATFFLLGRNATAYPALARRILAAGHTIGTHTFSHPLLSQLSTAAAEAEIDRGIAAIDRALGSATAPFFRFPGFASTPAILDRLERRRLVVFGADVWASDWNPMTPQEELALILERIEKSGGGIVLFHDTQPRTAAMLPAFLRALKARGFAVVHATGAPAAVAAVAEKPRHPRKLRAAPHP
jgi:peptidoglycan-N-acetylglucosamine deacetylase